MQSTSNDGQTGSRDHCGEIDNGFQQNGRQNYSVKIMTINKAKLITLIHDLFDLLTLSSALMADVNSTIKSESNPQNYAASVAAVHNAHSLQIGAEFFNS